MLSSVFCWKLVGSDRDSIPCCQNSPFPAAEILDKFVLSRVFCWKLVESDKEINPMLPKFDISMLTS